MSKDKSKTVSFEDRMDTIIGIVTVLIIFAIFGVLMWVASSRNVGEIVYASEVRRGNEQVFSYENDMVKKGDIVNWYVNNTRIKTYTYDGNDIDFVYTPQQEGDITIKVVAGKYNQSRTLQVKKPLLTITAQDITVTYGEEIPPLQYQYDGLLEDDTLESLNCNINCTTQCEGCGVYTIDVECSECDGYEICCNNALLTVLPKELHITNDIVKVYDQTNVLENAQLQLEGILDGDDVTASADKLYFESKNVGVQNIVTANILLSGADCGNYVLCNDLVGEILPKSITLDGLKISDKNFDGTTKAKIEKLGSLQGVMDGDSVAIGKLDVSFDKATTGEHEIIVNDVTLVGLDKDNYTLENIYVPKAKITIDVNK